MGKKKGKGRSPREDEEMDMSGPSCRHIKKGSDQAVVKKLSGNTDWTHCQGCHNDRHDKDDSGPSQETQPGESGPVWMCLKCGHRGCGRHSENQHAIKHYETPRSDPHCLVVCLDNWAVWCYICDDEVQFSPTGLLAQLLTNLKKLASTEPSRKIKEEVSEVERELGALELDESEEREDEGSDERPREKEKRKSPSRATQEGSGDSVKGRSVPEEGRSTSEEGRGVPVKGLSNLGNTCFFNAVIQNLSQTHILRDAVNKITEEKITLNIQPDAASNLEPLRVHLERPGPLTLTMCQLLNEIQESKKNAVTPRDLFTQVCKKAARFKGFQQQDSQELLRYLLDGMRAEEIKRASSGLMESLKESATGSEEQLKALVKEYEKNATPKNFVDQVFGGEMTSTVMCQRCRTVSVVKEMFLDLSLPVSDEAYRKKSLKKAAQKSSNGTEEERDAPALTNGVDDTPSGSKYQQKKAKKQAKKQAKNQRRQQKLDGRTSLDSLSSPQSNDAEAESCEEEADGESSGERMDADSEAKDPNGIKIDNDEEQEEATANSRFSPLSNQCPDDSSSDLDKTCDSTRDEDAVSEKDLDQAFIADGENGADAGENREGKGENGGDDFENGAADGEDETVKPEEAAEYTVVNQDPDSAFRTLARRTAPERQECSVRSCLHQFTEVETLTQNNSLLCTTCTKRQHRGESQKSVYTDALKQMLISSAPPVLTLHLKRFQQNGFSICKVNRHVQFPALLDLAPFCAASCREASGPCVPQEEGEEGEEGEGGSSGGALYSLYGIVEHSGTMRSGHYTAFVKVRPRGPHTDPDATSAPGVAEPPRGSWFHISDTSVQPVSESKALSSQAYLLFYERLH